jgi:hypothetical protein
MASKPDMFEQLKHIWVYHGVSENRVNPKIVAILAK